MRIRGNILRKEESKHLVFGWASVAGKNGKEIVDSDGDVIELSSLELAAYDFTLNANPAKAEHKGVQVAQLIESFALTPEKAEAMGMLTETFGWWVGFKVIDEDVWEGIVNGKYSMFSIAGKVGV